MKKKIGIVVGSLRKDSYNRRIAKAVVDMLPDEYEATFLDIGQLPFYNEDLDSAGTPPEEYVKFRRQVQEQDAYLFVTPEYNRSVPAVLKNALDVASRPYGSNRWDGKPAGVISVSTGAISGFGANHHLRQSLVFLNVHPMQQPEAYIGNAASLFDEAGKLKEAQAAFLKDYLAALDKHFNRY